MRTCLLVVGILAALARPAAGDALDPKLISADARWMVHLDVDGLWATRTTEQLLKPLADLEHVQRERKKFRDALGFDMIDDIHAVTLYGDQFTEGQGVVLIRADVDEGRIAGFLAKQPDYEPTEYTGRKLHAWTDRHHGKKGTLFGCIYRAADSAPASSSETDAPKSKTLLVVSRNRNDVQKALDVLDGRIASLEVGNPLLAGRAESENASQTPIVTIGARGLAEAAMPLRSPVLRHCEVLNLLVGERGDDVYVSGRLVAKSDQSAADVRQVLDGVLAMGRLAGDSNKELQKVIKMAEVSAEGRIVTVQWHGQAADVVRAAREQWINKHLPVP